MPVPSLPRALWVSLALAVTAAGCSYDGVEDRPTAAPAGTDPDRTSAAVSPTTPPTSPSTAAGAPTVTTAPGAAPASTLDLSGCASPGPLPAAATAVASRRADVDADGTPDTLTSYAAVPAPGPGDWRLRVELGRGGGSEFVVAEDPAPGAVQVVGTAVLGPTDDPGVGGARPVIFVWTSSGASARNVTLFRVDGCELLPMTRPTGGIVSMLVGGSAAHQEGVRCERTDAGTVLVEVTSESVPAGYEVTERTWARQGHALVPVGAPDVAVRPAPPPEAGFIRGCGDVP